MGVFVLQLVAVVAAVNCGWRAAWIMYTALDKGKVSFRFAWKTKDGEIGSAELNRWDLVMLAAVLLFAACASFMTFMKFMEM